MKNIIIITILFLSCKDKANTVINSKPEIVVELASKEKANILRGSELETTIKNSNLESNIDNNNTSGFIRTDLYRGTIDGTIKISFYLQEQEHPCGGNLTILDAMYKYENQENWLLLNITANKQKKKYCMVENDFTGVLFLEENE